MGMVNLGSGFGARVGQFLKRGQKPVGPVPVPGTWDTAFTSRMPKGASMTPAGDIGERRQRESVAVGGFKDGETVRASRVFKGGK